MQTYNENRVLVFYDKNGFVTYSFDTIREAVKKTGMNVNTINNVLWRNGRLKNGGTIQWVDIEVED